MKKCILLSRVSTHSQDLKQQTDELINAAHKDGYKDENIIIIEDKESAIKLTEEERNGLNELKRHINEDELINCVYVYEVSRIARKEKILFSIRDFLIEKHIQLVILQPYLKLLDADYNMTQSSQIMFAMFGAFAESEMHIRKQRMMRGKRAKSENGYYVGGKVLFGYKVREDKKFIVDEQKADIVRKMFNMYLNGETISSVTTELSSLGELDSLSWRAGYIQVQRLLTRPEYYGGNSGIINNYPPIISKELFDEVQKLLHDRSRPHSKTKYVYYAHKLLRDRRSNHCFSPTMSNCTYRYMVDTYIKDEEKHLRVECWHININLVDSILWHFARKYRKNHSVSDFRKMRKEINSKLNILERKIVTGKNKIEEYQKRINKANERIVYGKMSEEQGDKLIMKSQQSIDELQRNISQWNKQLITLNNEYQGLNIDVYQKSVDNVQDDRERHDIIHQCMKVVWVDKVARATYRLEIVFIDDSTVTFETVPNNFYRFRYLDGTWEYFERFDRYMNKWELDLKKRGLK